jgi:hypothetical protein
VNTCLRGIATLALWIGLLGGCVTFEHAPVARYGCDPALAGRWQTVKSERLPRPIEVGADCRMRWPLDEGGTHESVLRSFKLDDVRYLAFTPEEADRLMEMEGDLIDSAPAGSVLLVRYRIDGEEVNLWLADPEVALTPAPAGIAPARRLEDRFAHVEGSRRATAKLLRERGDALFRASQSEGMTRFTRVTVETAP